MSCFPNLGNPAGLAGIKELGGRKWLSQALFRGPAAQPADTTTSRLPQRRRHPWAVLATHLAGHAWSSGLSNEAASPGLSNLTLRSTPMSGVKQPEGVRGPEAHTWALGPLLGQEQGCLCPRTASPWPGAGRIQGFALRLADGQKVWAVCVPGPQPKRTHKCLCGGCQG